MANKTSLIKWTLVSLVICALLIVVVFSLTPSDKRQPKVDYLAEYNRISKPANLDPNDNAAQYFDKAFELMSDAPDDFDTYKKLWPADMNDDQLQIVKQWVEVNKQTLDYLKLAVSKSYYWKPRVFDNNKPLLDADLDDLKLFRQAAYMLCIEAKMTANDEQTGPALRQLVDVYKMGTFFTGPRFLVEQLVGIAISGLAVNSAFQIIDHTNPSPVILEDFQQRITSLSPNQSFLIDFAVERLMFYDALDRLCTGYGQKKLSENPGLLFKKLFQETVGRAWAAREKRRGDMIFDYIDNAKSKTPWQLHSEGNDVNSVTEKMVKGTLFLRMLAPSFDRVLFISYRIQVQTDALIAATAILRYKADKGRYPQDLQQLVTAGYLEKLPMDPFSGSALAYRVTGDNFELYSFAQDLDDDGGKHDKNWADEGDGDFVFWPIQKSI